MQDPINRRDDPAVIIGMACRVPGATNPAELWDMIVQQRDVQRKIPEDRWNVDNFYHADGANKGTTNARHGYFLDQDIRDFDAGFFGISGKEAEAMDPQQRLLLEVVYEALENAGITLEEASGSNTSVFCGCFTKDYDMMIAKDWDAYPKHTVTGTGGAILANRISYFFNLLGTSVTVDTACSSSLVCLHLGRQSILDGESDMSIIVGSSLHFDPREYLLMTDLGMLSKDGRSRAFDIDANGYARGEGICAVILKKQSVAETNADNIRAVIRATGANHDGRTQGITLPSPEAQAALIRSTYASVGLNFKDTQYFEAHGTGTQAGDPRETSAIGAVFSPGRELPLYIGSVKTNIGHLEGSSGLAGLIKTTMALEHRQIPPNMLFKIPNPKINFDECKLSVPTRTIAWETDGVVRRASVNSFGYGGTNAHVILEEYLPAKTNGVKKIPSGAQRPYLISLSSHSIKAGEDYEKKLQHHLNEAPEIQIEDLAFSFSSKRSLHEKRSFIVAEDIDDVIDQLTQHRSGGEWTSARSTAPRLGYVFTGQGGQWYAMGRQLILAHKLFRQTLERCDNVLQELGDAPQWSVVTELLKTKESSLLGETEYSQPLCTAIQLALVDLLKSWGVLPTAVVGHSSGEMAAAYAAGILSFDNALIAAYYRGLYMSASTGSKIKGSMMAIGMSEDEAEREVQAYGGRISIAAINSASTMTISGDEDAILELKKSLAERKIFCRQLQVSQAFHSHHMYELAPAYEAALDRLSNFTTEQAACRMVSSVTGSVADASSMGPTYWAENMTNKVRFSQALEGILKDDEGNDIVDVLIEIGPHPALKGPSRQIQQAIGTDKPYLASLTRGTPDFGSMLTLAGQLFSQGVVVDLVAVNSEANLSSDMTVWQSTAGKRLADLPTYSWDHRKYWAETRYTKELRLRASRHSILGAPVPGSFSQRPRWRNYLVLAEHPWLSDHVIDNRVVFPGAGYISMAIEAVALQMSDLAEVKSFQLNDIVIKAALLLPDSDSGVEIMLELRPCTVSSRGFSDSEYEFVICSFATDGQATEHCHGTISAISDEQALLRAADKFGDDDTVLAKTDRSESATSFYNRLRALGLDYGERFALLTGTIVRGNGFAVADISFDDAKLPHEYYDQTIVHPTLLDSSFHVGFSAIESCLGRQLKGPFVPTCVKSMSVSGSMLHSRTSTAARDLQICCYTDMPSRRVAISDMLLRTRVEKAPLITIEGLEVTSLGRDGADDTARHLFFSQHWRPAFDLLEPDSSLDTEITAPIVVELFTHQHPNARVLHVPANLNESVTLAQQLGLENGSERSAAHLDIYTLAKPASSESETFSNFRGFDIVDQLEIGAYDLILAERESDVDLESLLKEHGVLVSGATTRSKLPSLMEQVHMRPLSIARHSQESLMSTEDMLVVLPTDPSQHTRNVLAELVGIYGERIVSHDWRSIADTLDCPRTVVVIANLDCAFGSEEEFLGAQRLLTSKNHQILWLTTGSLMDCCRPEIATVLGFLRSARSENDTINIKQLDVDPASQAEMVARTISRVLRPSNVEEEMAERKGCVYIPRIKSDHARNSKVTGGALSQAQPCRLETSQAIKLQIGQFGAIDSLQWVAEAVPATDLGPDEVEILVKASNISLQDIETCRGTYAAETLGSECAGVISRVGSDVDPLRLRPGDRVVAWLPGQGCHATIVRGPANLCSIVPTWLSFAQAATLPSALLASYQALVEIGRLRRGERVLIHRAASLQGQVAVQLAIRIGAEIFFTTSSDAETTLLVEQYGLDRAQVCSANATEFPGHLAQVSGGRGMDVIVSPFTGAQWRASLQCLAPFGRFIDMSPTISADDTRMGLRTLTNNCSYATVDMNALHQHSNERAAHLLANSFKLLHDGHIHPPRNISEFPYANASKGFKLVQASSGTESAVLVPNNGELISMLPPKFDQKPLFDPTRVYLLVGGLGGLGRSMSEWMFQRGARKIAFLSRSGATRAVAKATVDWLEGRGVEVQVFAGDVSNLSDVAACIHKLGAGLAGIFHAAMVLQDVPLEKMNYEQWQACTGPKILGAQNLHLTTLHLNLDFFVVFSSVAAVLGSKAQANYAAANSFLDAFVRYRRGLGLSGTSINVGAVGDMGVIAESETLRKIMDRMGMDMISGEELLYQLEEAVCAKPSANFGNIGSGIIDEHSIITGISLSRPDVEWAAKPLLRNLYANHDFGKFDATVAESGVPLITLLAAASGVMAKAAILADALIDRMASSLATPRESIDPRKSLSTYGLDSIVAVEFRKWFRVAAGVDVAVFDILGPLSVEALCEQAVSSMDSRG